MPNKVLNQDILRSIAKKLRNSIDSEVWMNYQDFHDALIEDEVYTSDPSIRNAWIRIRGGEYCAATTKGRTPTTKKMLIRIGWLRHDLGIEYDAGENKKTNRATAEAF